VYPCVDQVRGYIDWFFGVDENIFMFRGIVGCARGYVQHVLLVVRHACVGMLFDVDILGYKGSWEKDKLSRWLCKSLKYAWGRDVRPVLITRAVGLPQNLVMGDDVPKTRKQGL
jgi:hypothetical protein